MASCYGDQRGRCESRKKCYARIDIKSVGRPAVLLERHEIVDEWTRVRNRWTLIRAGSVRAFEFTQSLEYATGCEELPSGPE